MADMLTPPPLLAGSTEELKPALVLLDSSSRSDLAAIPAARSSASSKETGKPDWRRDHRFYQK